MTVLLQFHPVIWVPEMQILNETSSRLLPKYGLLCYCSLLYLGLAITNFHKTRVFTLFTESLENVLEK